MPFLANQISMEKLFEMKGQCVRCDPELFSQCARRQAFDTGHHKGAKYAQSGLMG